MHTRSIFKNMKEILKEKEERGENVYKFQEVKINDVTCIFEIHFIKKIFVVKAKHIYVLFDEENKYYGKYILHHLKYNNLEELLFHVSKIYTDYSFYNGELLPSSDIKKKLTERKIIYDNNGGSRCSICYDQTTEMTQCNHSICLKCREKVLTTSTNKRCPICRDKDGIYYFKTESENIYNINHSELDIINNEEIINNASNNTNIATTSSMIFYTPDEIPPILQMVLLREIINNNISYPALVIYSGFRTFYNYKWQIGFFLFSTMCLFYAINENYKSLKDKCC